MCIVSEKSSLDSLTGKIVACHVAEVGSRPTPRVLEVKWISNLVKLFGISLKVKRPFWVRKIMSSSLVFPRYSWLLSS